LDKQSRDKHRTHKNGVNMRILVSESFEKLRIRIDEDKPVFMQYIDGVYSVQIGWDFQYSGQSPKLGLAVAKAIYLYDNQVTKTEIARECA